MTRDSRQKRRKSSSMVPFASSRRAAGRTPCLRPAAAETLERRRLLSGSYALNAIGAFNGTTPTGSVAVDAQGTVYGTTSTGGANGDGYVYKIVAGSNAITEVASFNSTDQFSGVTVGNNGVLYGTTLTGGANGTGAVYQIASGSGNITLLNSLPSSEPEEGLYGTTTVAVDANGNTFGTYTAFAEIGYNFLYEISAGGTDTAIATFNTGLITYSPLALTLDASGNLYGATQSEGSEQLFKVAAGTTSVTTLVNGLNVTPSTLSIDPAGNLYGATAPTSGNPTIPGPGSEFFEIPSASASATVLDTFPSEGSDPFESVTLGSSGNLFGTTPAGGVNSDGSVFEIPAGTTTPVTIASFNGTGNGQTPLAALAMDAGGDLYGSTTTGGTNSHGTAFELTPVPASHTQIVTNSSDSGAGSLRAAITYANSNPGVDTIKFNIPTTDPNYNASTGTFTISPLTALPPITDPTIIDGTTQPHYSAAPLVDLYGGGGLVTEGLVISAGSSTVKGLAINGFGDAGIILQTGGGNVISGNYLGTNFTGTAASANAIAGITISGSSNNVIGGTTAAARNVISGNSEYGIQAADGNNNVIEGNYIGTNAAGTAAIANRYAGIELDGSLNPVNHQNTTIGGLTAGARNIISGNGGEGISFYSATKTIVEGNYIGTDVTGTLPIPNILAGIQLSANTSNATIGGSSANASNIIAFNGNGSAGSGGVVIASAGGGATPVSDAVLWNSIFSNNGLGISLGSGANNGFAAPTITGVTTTGASTTITVQVTAPVGSTVHIEIYSSSTAAAGQGQRLLIGGTVKVPANGIITAKISALTGTQFISATLTDATNDTSQFSAPVRVN